MLYKQPQGKSFTVLQKAIKDPLIPAKLKLVEFIASKLNGFLRAFQTDQPMVPFLCDVLKDLLSSVMKMFILSGRSEYFPEYNLLTTETWFTKTFLTPTNDIVWTK